MGQDLEASSVLAHSFACAVAVRVVGCELSGGKGLKIGR
jgi:hypothetical protein